MLGVVGDHRHRGSVCARAGAAAPPVVGRSQYEKPPTTLLWLSQAMKKDDIIPRVIRDDLHREPKGN